MQNTKTPVKASIVGASGYSGAMTMRILLRHSGVGIDSVFASTSAGEKVSALYPDLRNRTELAYKTYSPEAVAGSDLVFLALPAGEAMQIVPGLLSAGKKVIDLGGDYRLKDADTYAKYYKQEHTSIDIQSRYGLPELARKDISSAGFISNPGCYPTSTIIPLAPLLKFGLIEPENISISSLSGVSGAGKKSSVDFSFAEIDGSVKAYRIADHQHIPEIESVLSEYSAQKVTIDFVPHLLPAVRGIYTTIFTTPNEKITASEIANVFGGFFSGEPFVRYLGNEIPELKNVLGTNFIDIGWKFDSRTGKLIVVSAIDNLIKGAAGQAVQNMNIMCGFEETTGLL